MSEPAVSAASRARGTVARSFNATAQKASLRAAKVGRANKKAPSRAGNARLKTASSRASSANKRASSYIKNNRVNLTKPATGNKGKKASANKRRRGR